MALNIKPTAAPPADTTTASTPVIRRPAASSGNGHKPAAAFKRITDADVHRRMIISLSGEEKSGKDHTAFTAPGPIYVHSFDIGLEGVVDKFIKEKEIYVAEYELEIQPGEASVQEVADSADKLWRQFVSNYKDGLASCGSGTSVCDTISEAWALIRLARFGKLAQVQPHHYGPVNAEFRDLIRESYNYDANVFLLSKNVDVWENYVGTDGKEKGRKTGQKGRSGFADLGFLTQINAVCQREDLVGGGSEFSVLIEDCRFSPDANGIVVPNSYDMISLAVFGE